MTLRYDARSCGEPSRPTVREAQPIPAQLTTARNGAPVATAASTAAVTEFSSATSVLTNRPPVSAATALPCSSLRSATTAVAPAAASLRATAAPSPLAPPEMIAAVPFSFMGGSILRGSARRPNRVRVCRPGRRSPSEAAPFCRCPGLRSWGKRGAGLHPGQPPGAGVPGPRRSREHAVTKFRGNPWAVLLVVSLGFFMTLLDLTIVNIAIPDMITRLHASLDDVLWVINAYALGACRPGDHGRTARRPDRAADHVRGGDRRVHGGLRRVRAGPEPRLADRVPRGPGPGRGHADAADPDHHHQYVPGRSAAAPRSASGARWPAWPPSPGRPWAGCW